MTQQPDQPEPHVQATRYTVNCIPEDTPNADVYAIAVEYRGNGRWAVIRHRQELDADGAWSYKPGWPDGQEPTDDAGWDAYYAAVGAWTAAHRHDRDTALRLAREAAPHVTVMGATPADALARIAPPKRRGERTMTQPACASCEDVDPASCLICRGRSQP